MSKSALLKAQVPRYTSYPTAPHFHAGVGRDDYGQWLADIPAGMALSLYLHIPFCDTLCWFCGCHTSVIKTYPAVAQYCDLLAQEIEIVSRSLGNEARPVAHIHWGGGSPTILSPESIAQLDRALRRRFDILPGAEVAVEIDPRALRQDTVDAFARTGLTRASIGLQDCDPLVQKAINRIQPREVTAAAVALLRKAGITSINLDLIYGLPKQTEQSWLQTLDFALELQPDRLSIFGYAHVPSFKKHQSLIPVDMLPDWDARARLADTATRILTAHGYVAIGLDHFAKSDDSLTQSARDGTLTRNFQGYTNDDASVLIGLGASAIGMLPQGYVQNASSVPDYRTAIASGQLAASRGVRLTADDRIRRYIIQRLMCDLRVDLRQACADFGTAIETLYPSVRKLESLVETGAVTVTDDVITVPAPWRAAIRQVCAAFDTYREEPNAHMTPSSAPSY